MTIDKEWLEEQYYKQNKSMTEIAQSLNVAYSTVNRWIKLYQIKPRSNGEHKKKNLTNLLFGSWTAIEEVGPAKSGHTQWLCRCKCGKELIIEANALNSRTMCRICNGYKNRIKGRLSKTFWNQIKDTSKKRNLEFLIDRNEAYNLLLTQNWKCNLSGLDIKLADTTVEHGHGKTTCSLDRINSDMGYLINNIQWVHKDINMLKSNFKEKEFIYFCKLVSTPFKLNPVYCSENKISNCQWNGYQRGAKRRKISFEITKNYAWNIYLNQGGKCAITGVDINFPYSTYTMQKFNDGTASLDRINNSKGYVENNVQWVTKQANKIKWKFDLNYMIELCKLVTNHQSILN